MEDDEASHAKDRKALSAHATSDFHRAAPAF